MENKRSETEKKIRAIKKRLLQIGLMHPGSLRPQYNVCGSPNCRCKDKENPEKHGPYYNLSYTFKKKNSTKFIREARVEEFKGYVNNYKEFRACVEELVELNLQAIQERGNQK